ncbi:hypothetical protein NEF87_005117 [Candidatus Lokiarchaeum ossiferum]|uniref:GTP-binding protein n=1 Tax=Candidatus Lokiarchaeum ossiferum TaxID=2951803 RepID=A0ABY6I2Q0_9ARCH|nr:hypothetical protein NEF87_005117 [Candidatus Lokiarchaeum sp. B-35]
MEQHKIFVFGIDQAGKTALISSIREDKLIQGTKPTLSFNITKLITKNIVFQIWDAPGQVSFRDVWIKGIKRAKINIFVLDVLDSPRFEEAKREFEKVLDNPLTRNVPFIFCFHKMDLLESQQNLKKARDFFQLSQIRHRKILSYETSIMKMESLRKFKSTLADIVLDIMW